MEWILEHTPDERQVVLFSATMPKPIARVTENYLRDPVRVKIAASEMTVERIEQCYWLVKGTNKLDALTRILEVEEYDGVVIFVRTKAMSVDLAERLSARGHAVSAINGDMNQASREKCIDQLKSGRLDILVATDVAARGIDVPRISHVLNYDIPYDNEAYVHRIGRTGRAGRNGKAILFVSPRERRLLRSIEKTTGASISEMQLPSREQVSALRREQFKTRITETLEEASLGYFETLVGEYLNEHGTDPRMLAAALAKIAQDGQSVLVPAKTSREETPRQSDESSRTPRSRDRDERRPPRERRDDRRDERKSERRDDRQQDGEKVDMEKFRIAVGYDHEVKPGEIVGAIANEADISSQYIGRIDIRDDHSIVELPEGMPKALFKHLKKVWVRGQQLQITRLGEKPAEGDAAEQRRGNEQPRRPERGHERGDRRDDNRSQQRREKRFDGRQDGRGERRDNNKSRGGPPRKSNADSPRQRRFDRDEEQAFDRDKPLKLPRKRKVGDGPARSEGDEQKTPRKTVGFKRKEGGSKPPPKRRQSPKRRK